jgi:hypothetical protein
MATSLLQPGLLEKLLSVPGGRSSLALPETVTPKLAWVLELAMTAAARHPIPTILVQEF